MNPILRQKRDEMAALCRRFGVLRLEVFGSAIGDRFTALSDVDFLVEFEEPRPLSAFDQYFGLKEGLERILSRPVDLVVASAIRNPVFRAEVERTKLPVYAAA